MSASEPLRHPTAASEPSRHSTAASEPLRHPKRLQERFRATGRATEQPRSGRPRCTSTQDDRFLYLSTPRDRSITSTTLRRQLMNAVYVNVSASTILSRLHEAGLRSRSTVVRSPLTPAHCCTRAAWCRRYLRWTRQQWSESLFADESRFTVAFNDGRRRV